MKTTLSTAKLSEIMDIMTRFVSRNTTLPILENVYIKGGIDTIIFRASDMEKHIEIEIPATLDTEWVITVNAKKLADYIKTIDETEINLTIDQTKHTLAIKTSVDNFKINGIAGSEYLWLPSVDSTNTITADAMSISKGISKVEYAITDKNFSPVLTGVLMRIKVVNGEKKMIFVGTDSFRLAEYRMPFGGEGEECSIVIPKSNITEIKKVIDFYVGKWGSQTTISYSHNLIGWKCDHEDMKITLVSLLIQWAFPDYDNENILPTKFNTTVVLDKATTDKAVKKVAIMTRDLNNFITLDVGSDRVIFDSSEVDEGNINTTASAIVQGNPIKFNMNGRYLSDIIRYTSSNELTINIVAEDKPVLFTDKDDAGYRYVIRTINK